MDVLRKIIFRHKEKKQLINEVCDEYIFHIDLSLQKINTLFEDMQSFIQPDMENEWRNKNTALLEEISKQNIQRLRSASNYKTLLSKQEELYSLAQSLKQKISSHNEQVANAKIQNAYELIGDVEGQKLDRQQMMCIVKEAHNHLVIAGAGTGKTTTIVGKIKFLLKSGIFKPEDILVLSFTNASASEMSQRINNEAGCFIEASTFHKLGLNIITDVEGTVPKITQLNTRKFIKEQLLKNMESPAYLKLLSSYLLYNRIIAKSEFEFNTEEEYKDYLKLNPPTTLNNETVKSYGELDIANFLTANGIRYIYEQPYEIDTRTSEYAQYKPDFYLPEYHVYIEYFGINEHGEVPSYFRSYNGMSATERYQASMKWKRETHETNHTILIECYSYEKFGGILLDNLRKKLLDNGVELSPKSEREIWENISSKDNSMLDGVIELFETVINLIKSNGYNIQTVRQLNIENNHIQSNNTILSLIEPIFDSYCTYLNERGEIDFNDMITLAKKYVETERFVNPYKVVIVDEYQDISKARFSLLNSMRKSNDFDLFCVGDDWQSIYRFAGSDIGFILDFEHYWGPTEISKIETTYRFTQGLIEISGEFIMQNPAQIKKNLKGKEDLKGFVLGEINGYTDKNAVEFMVNKLDDLPKDSTVFFIGRYNFDAKMLDDSESLNCQYNNINKIIDVKYNKRPDLHMGFVTAHKSKGLQADYIFIINNKRSKMGFPSKVQDAPILSLLLERCDLYPYAEERRLYYVALTRAKKKVFIVTVANQESEFALELKERYRDQLKREKYECPMCGGQLLKRTGSYGDFFGCSNYQKMGCTYKRKIYKNM